MAPPRYRSRLQDELARNTRASSGLRQVELDERTLAAAARISSSVLSITDLAERSPMSSKISGARSSSTSIVLSSTRQ